MTGTTRNHNPNDERNFSRRYHRQAALEGMELAEQEREEAEAGERDPNWQEITYWQRDAHIHALLALSAES